MYALNKQEGKTVLLVCGSPDTVEFTRVLRDLEIARENVHFVGANEMAVIAQLQAEELKKRVLDIQKLIPVDSITIKRKHREKPHHDRNVLRLSRKSRW
jgi:FMN phosphatase YigB (HAD superfamily)